MTKKTTGKVPKKTKITESKEQSNSASTGSAGPFFEMHVQANFVVLMLTGGYVPYMRLWPIKEIKLQSKIYGYETDDVTVTVENLINGERHILFGSIKRSVNFVLSNKAFSDVIASTWKDFNSPNLFSKGKDKLAMIVRTISSSDYDDLKWISAQANVAINSEDFFTRVETPKFSSESKRAMVLVFQKQLQKANNGIPVQSEDLYQFLKHFIVLAYDLGDRGGIVLSMLHSHISQFNKTIPGEIWSRIVEFTQSYNQDAGVVTLEKVPQDIRDYFSRQEVISFPVSLAAFPKTTSKPIVFDKDIALVSLIGGWDENNKEDNSVIEKITGEVFSFWIKRIKDRYLRDEIPLEQTGGHWTVIEKQLLWPQSAKFLFDEDLRNLQEVAVDVFKSPDPKFDLKEENQPMARVLGHNTKHSYNLRKGLSDSLAIVKVNSEYLVNVSNRNANATSILTIRQVLTNADWKNWASLNDFLPILAESAPNEFLKIVENSLKNDPSPFDFMYPGQNIGVFGTNKMSGLLWAIEGLAWEPATFLHCCLLLAKLALRDPGGNSGNRPIFSLKNILLPWSPHTLAPVAKRIVALKAIVRDYPEVGWTIAVGSLPNQQAVSMGTYRPVWAKIVPEDYKGNVDPNDYWEQVKASTMIAIEMAGHDPLKLKELISHFDKIHLDLQANFFALLSSNVVLSLSESDKAIIWDALNNFINRHRKYHKAYWALREDILAKLQIAADAFAPKDILNYNRRMFSDSDYLLYNEKENFEVQEANLNAARQEAIKQILSLGGFALVRQFLAIVERPNLVGYGLGPISNSSIDEIVLPQFLNSLDRSELQFIAAYVASKAYTLGTPWIESIDRLDWTIEQLAIFLTFLPYNQDTWKRTEIWLKESEGEYWKRVNAYQGTLDKEYAISKLIEYNRPLEAIYSLYSMTLLKLNFDPSLAVTALKLAVRSPEVLTNYAGDPHEISTVIKYLQENENTDQMDLLQLEWTYLHYLRIDDNVFPKVLEKHVSENPSFFHELISAGFVSKKTSESIDKKETNPQMAYNAYTLFEHWRTPPGLLEDNSFSEAALSDWLIKAKILSLESGHIDIALQYIGKSLYYAPASDTLWIHEAAAKVLDHEDHEQMRKGYYLSIYNSRGAHFVDPTAAPEKAYAEEYRNKADQVENAGFIRFANTLRDIAGNFDAEAERIINDKD